MFIFNFNVICRNTSSYCQKLYNCWKNKTTNLKKREEVSSSKLHKQRSLYLHCLTFKLFSPENTSTKGFRKPESLYLSYWIPSLFKSLPCRFHSLTSEKGGLSLYHSRLYNSSPHFCRLPSIVSILLIKTFPRMRVGK